MSFIIFDILNINISYVLFSKKKNNDFYLKESIFATIEGCSLSGRKVHLLYNSICWLSEGLPFVTNFRVSASLMMGIYLNTQV